MKKKSEIRAFRPSRWWSNVTALRVDSGISETDLATLVGVSDKYFTQALKNGGAPNISIAIAIADIFGVTIEDLAFGAIGLEIRQRQLEAELAKIKEEIADAQNDVARLTED